MPKLRVINKTRGTMLADRADIADTSQKRRTGLLKHTGLAPGEGLWITPCEGVHTFAMKFTIDVVFLNRQKRVAKLRHKMPPRRISIGVTAPYALLIIGCLIGMLIGLGTAVEASLSSNGILAFAGFAIMGLGLAAIMYAMRGRSVLEFPAGRLAETGTQRGDQLEFEKWDTSV